MGIQDLLGLLGGLALFLYGMQMMSDGLEEAAGNRMKEIRGRSHYRCDPVLLRYHRHGGGLC